VEASRTAAKGGLVAASKIIEMEHDELRARNRQIKSKTLRRCDRAAAYPVQLSNLRLNFARQAG
jgi:hypothetical protein